LAVCRSRQRRERRDLLRKPHQGCVMRKLRWRSGLRLLGAIVRPREARARRSARQFTHLLRPVVVSAGRTSFDRWLVEPLFVSFQDHAGTDHLEVILYHVVGLITPHAG
jgi:hypothetical protein